MKLVDKIFKYSKGRNKKVECLGRDTPGKNIAVE